MMAEFLLPTPPLPDIARARGDDVREMGRWFIDYYNAHPVPWNYRRSTRIVRVAHKGLHNLSTLVAGCAAEKNTTGRSSNSEVVSLAAPLAFGRNTQVFDLTPRRFPFGRDRTAAYRIPFLFIENGIIKVYFLQPRKGAGLDMDDFGMVATAVKQHLLDTEFYGERTDVEFVDVSSPEERTPREVRRYTMADLKLWSDRRFRDKLSLASEALDWAAKSGQIEQRRRTYRRPEPEMPLFD